MIISHERAREIIQEEVRKKHKINEQEDPLPGDGLRMLRRQGSGCRRFRRRRAGFAWIGWHGGPDFTENDRELLEAMQRVLIDSKRKYNRSMPGENQFQYEWKQQTVIQPLYCYNGRPGSMVYTLRCMRGLEAE